MTATDGRAVQAWLEHAGIESGPILGAVDRHGNTAERNYRSTSIAEPEGDHARLRLQSRMIVVQGVRWTVAVPAVLQERRI